MTTTKDEDQSRTLQPQPGSSPADQAASATEAEQHAQVLENYATFKRKLIALAVEHNGRDPQWELERLKEADAMEAGAKALRAGTVERQEQGSGALRGRSSPPKAFSLDNRYLDALYAIETLVHSDAPEIYDQVRDIIHGIARSKDDNRELGEDSE